MHDGPVSEGLEILLFSHLHAETWAKHYAKCEKWHKIKQSGFFLFFSSFFLIEIKNQTLINKVANENPV